MVMLMDWDARGMHLHLMCIAWQQHPPCTLPDDDEILQKWLGNPADWPRLKKQILRAWKTEGGRLVQNGLLAEWQKQQRFSQSRSENASKRWAKVRAQQTECTGDAHADHTQCSASSLTTAEHTTHEQRLGTLCRSLRALGIEAAPHLPAWTELLAYYSDAQILAAGEHAAHKKPGERLHLNYLLPVLADLNKPKTRRNAHSGFAELDYQKGVDADGRF